MPVSPNREEAERDMARYTAEIEAQGGSIMGGCVSERADGSVVWVVCPGVLPDEHMPELTPEEAKARLEELLRNAPPPEPLRVPGWYPGDKPTGKDLEYVRQVAERKRREQAGPS